MKKMNKKCLLIFLTGIFIVSGCKNEVKNNEVNLDMYNTPYTQMKANEDGTFSLYVYASPVAYEDGEEYKNIDCQLKTSSKEEYLCESSDGIRKSYLPSKLTDKFLIKDDGGEIYISFRDSYYENFSSGILTEYKNMYGDNVKAVEYIDEKDNVNYYIYATNTGLYVECQQDLLNTFPKIEIESKAESCEKKGNGYVLLKNRKNKELVVSEPVCISDDGQCIFGRFGCKKENNGNYMLSGRTNNENISKKVTIGFSISRYVNKIPDTNVCSKKDINSYLREYAIVGENIDYGTCWDFLRFRINYFIGTEKNNIISAEYYTKLLFSDSETEKPKMYLNKVQWSSTRMTWATMEDEQKGGLVKISDGSVNESNELIFDMTDFVKKSISDMTWATESYGGLIKQETGYSLIASSDNSIYVPYLKINMKELPEHFSGREEINEEIIVQERF